MTEVPLARVDDEVVGDRHPLAIRNEVHDPPRNSEERVLLLRDRELLVGRREDPPRRAEQRLPELVLEHADRLAGGVVDVVAAADVDDAAGLDAEELLVFPFVGEETDVLAKRHSLLAHEGHGTARRRLPHGERRDSVEVDDRTDELLDQEAVVLLDLFVRHDATVPPGRSLEFGLDGDRP